MPPYNCIPGSTLITFVVYIAVRLLYAYRVFNVFKQLKYPPINQLGVKRPPKNFSETSQPR